LAHGRDCRFKSLIAAPSRDTSGSEVSHNLQAFFNAIDSNPRLRNARKKLRKKKREWE
jgi:hypothetical protein